MADKRNKLAATSVGMLVLTIGILVLLNFLASYTNVGRMDVTGNQLWSLSDGSRRLVSDLEDRMEITAYFTEDLPPPFNSTEQYVRDLLGEYEAASGGKLRVRFINPDDEELQEQAEEDGVRRVAHQVIENDSVSVREGYRGLVIKHLGESEAIPVIQDPTGLEYTITMKIKEMVGDKTEIGIVGGHGGPTLAEGLTGLRDTLPTYELTEVTLDSEIDPDLRALLIVSPAEPFSEDELRRIDQYVMRGGSLGVFGAGTGLEISGPAPTITATETGLAQLLGRYGVEPRSDVVLDWQCSRAPMRGPMGLQVAVPYPAVPIVTFDDAQMEHPALFRIPTAVLPFTSSLAVTSAPEGVSVEVLARSSENSWRQDPAGVNLQPRHPREWRASGEPGPFPLLVAVEGQLPSAYASSASMSPGAGEGASDIEAPAESEAPVRILVAGTAAFMRDEFLPQAGPTGERDLSGALAFALNAIDWLAAESDLIAIRAKNIEDPALEVPAAAQQAEEAARAAAEEGDEEAVEENLEEREEAMASWDRKKTFYRWGNTLGIPLAFALFGLIRWRQRNARRKNLKL
ncbi:MAG TPA: GldG family protein [Polyangiaceae bacterium LLY-WYZ-15_(1-7)]|nr:hypothetical protein [Myxococcales bacterium]MAT24505.1 hypothetical protein [Sandaracinus sp.]HJK93905.1 GldG family protein [Polyangiaceae bacterium LLY-WYZ-15_(1-7)]MBJ73507.1 hypothetical protein [Sandaracinus sp.]HJL01722.1 GldG family protein [Polyangiaceae bacterium LLY-WYZ-15_(1-7)]